MANANEQQVVVKFVSDSSKLNTNEVDKKINKLGKTASNTRNHLVGMGNDLLRFGANALGLGGAYNGIERSFSDIGGFGGNKGGKGGGGAGDAAAAAAAGAAGASRGLLMAAGITAAVVAGKALLDVLFRNGEKFDDLGKKARALDLTIKGMTDLAHGAKLAGIGIDELDNGLSHLMVLVGRAQFGEAGSPLLNDFLGNIDTSKIKTTEQFIHKLSDAFAKLNAQQKAAISKELFGKGGKRFMELFGGGSDSLKKLEEENRKLRITWDGMHTDNKNIESMNDSFTKLSATIEAFGTRVLASIAPAMQSFVEGMMGINTQAEKSVAIFRGLGTVVGAVGSGFQAWGDIFTYIGNDQDLANKKNRVKWMTSPAMKGKYTQEEINAAREEANAAAIKREVWLRRQKGLPIGKQLQDSFDYYEGIEKNKPNFDVFNNKPVQFAPAGTQGSLEARRTILHAGFNFDRTNEILNKIEENTRPPNKFPQGQGQFPPGQGKAPIR